MTLAWVFVIALVVLGLGTIHAPPIAIVGAAALIGWAGVRARKRKPTKKRV